MRLRAGLGQSGRSRRLGVPAEGPLVQGVAQPVLGLLFQAPGVAFSPLRDGLAPTTGCGRLCLRRPGRRWYLLEVEDRPVFYPRDQRLPGRQALTRAEGASQGCGLRGHSSRGLLPWVVAAGLALDRWCRSRVVLRPGLLRRRTMPRGRLSIGRGLRSIRKNRQFESPLSRPVVSWVMMVWMHMETDITVVPRRPVEAEAIHGRVTGL